LQPHKKPQRITQRPISPSIMILLRRGCLIRLYIESFVTIHFVFVRNIDENILKWKLIFYNTCVKKIILWLCLRKENILNYKLNRNATEFAGCITIYSQKKARDITYAGITWHKLIYACLMFNISTAEKSVTSIQYSAYI